MGVFHLLYSKKPGEELCRRSTVVQGKVKETVDKRRGESNKWCFDETGNSVKGNRRLAGRLLMIAYDTDGAVVVFSDVSMMMGNRDESGQEEQQYEESGK